MISGISVDLQDPIEAAENLFGVLAAAAGSVMIDDDGRVGSAMTAIVAKHRP